MRRGLAVSLVVGIAVGTVVGGTLGRVFMRVLTLAQDDVLGFETAMGAVIGEFTAGGTFFIFAVGAFFGAALGVAYVAGRMLLPSDRAVRTAIYVVSVTSFLVGTMIRGNRDDFSFLPVTLSIVLMGATAALTALPVPLLVERYAPTLTASLGGCCSPRRAR
jgi:hypothetical protein